jgi:hypothetical protein
MILEDGEIEERAKYVAADIPDFIGDERARGYLEGFTDGYKQGAHWMQETMFNKAAIGFEGWMSVTVESEMGTSTRRNTVTIEQELVYKFVWQAATLSMQKQVNQMIDGAGEDNERINKLKAENERLRHALEALADASECRGDEDCDHCVARAALREDK